MTIIHVAIEQHFVEYQGAIYTDFAFAYSYWQEYLQVFDRVQPIARVRTAAELPTGWKRADGPNVSFSAVTDYRGLWNFLTKIHKVMRDCYKAARKDGVYLLRGGNIGTFCWLFLMLRRRPYAVELVGHAGESVLTIKQVQFLGLNRLIAYVGHKLCLLKTKKAACASYVSRFVNNMYPTSDRTKEWIFSSVKLDERTISGPRTADSFKFDNCHIISVGRLEPEKGHIVFVEAIAKLIKSGYHVSAVLAGTGTEIEHLRQCAAQMGLAKIIDICGGVPWGAELFARLDQSHLFIIPSFTEGLPRALIEAMARGLPAIGSDVGGIKELLPDKYRIPPKDSDALAEKIKQVIHDPEQLAGMSRENFARAMEYRLEIMNQRKTEFWRYIKARCIS